MPKALHHIEWEELDKRKFYVVGPSLFMGIRLLIYPPLLIKTRIQVQKQTAVYKGTFDAFKKIWKYEGHRGFYRGFLVSSFGIISGQTYITTYELVRSSLSGYDNFTRGCVAGICASFAGQTITVPIDVISQKLMVQGSDCAEAVDRGLKAKEESLRNPKSPTDSTQKGRARGIHTSTSSSLDSIKSRVTTTGKAATDIPRTTVRFEDCERKGRMKGAFTIIREIFKNSGLLGFYRGYVASILTYAPSSGIWWGSYGFYTGLIGGIVPDDTPHMAVRAACGPLAGVTAAVATNPIDVIRTRVQVEGGTSITATAKKLFQEEGFRALHKGLSARMLSTLPTSFIIIVGYETVKRLSLKEEYKEKYALLNA